MKVATLMTPGPVPVPPEVLKILALPMEHHRTPHFIEIFGRVLLNLQKVFGTSEPVLMHTSTGSGGLESALVNTLSPGDHVLAIVSGKFGERWADMAETFGGKVTRLQVERGKAVDVASVKRELDANPKIKLVLTQACETSTGILHPVQELAQLTRNRDTLLLVDGITALGAMPLPMDQWGIDVLIGGSQKAFMLPTGLSFISFSKKAWSVVEKAKCPRFYFDAREELKANRNGESNFSASVTHIRALDYILEACLSQGLNTLFARISGLQKATLAAAQIMGLRPFAERPSPSVTAVSVPSGIDGQAIRSDMEKTFNVIIMGGQDSLKGKILRIGHMGAISDEDLLNTLLALANSLNRAKSQLIADATIAQALAAAKAILIDNPAVRLQLSP